MDVPDRVGRCERDVGTGRPHPEVTQHLALPVDVPANGLRHRVDRDESRDVVTTVQPVGMTNDVSLAAWMPTTI